MYYKFIICTLHFRPHVVNINWLVESIALKCTAPEEQFLAIDSSHAFTPESPSPLSKKVHFFITHLLLFYNKITKKKIM